MRCIIRRALADGRDTGTESTVWEEMGETLRLFKMSAGFNTGDPSEDRDAAWGGDVAAGTEAR